MYFESALLWATNCCSGGRIFDIWYAGSSLFANLFIEFCRWDEMASSQPSHNVEFEAAKFLQKLIQDSKDEPAKLATKLYVVGVLFTWKISLSFPIFVNSNILLFYTCLLLCMYSLVVNSNLVFASNGYLCVIQILQHMKASGKEHSMPYQVISRWIPPVYMYVCADIYMYLCMYICVCMYHVYMYVYMYMYCFPWIFIICLHNEKLWESQVT